MCCVIFLTTYCKNLTYFINENLLINSTSPQKILIVFFSRKMYILLSREHLSYVMLELSELTIPFMQLSLHQEAGLHF